MGVGVVTVVDRRRPARPEPIIVKAGRCRSRLHQRRCCVVCGAVLRDDHATADLVCDCHPRDGYNPRCDRALDDRVLVLLHHARGQTLNLCRALGAFPTKTNHDAIEDSVRRLNHAGFVRIVGVRGWGHRMAVARNGRGR